MLTEIGLRRVCNLNYWLWKVMVGCFLRELTQRRKAWVLKIKTYLGPKKKGDLKLIILCYLLGILKIAYTFYMQWWSNSDTSYSTLKVSMWNSMKLANLCEDSSIITTFLLRWTQCLKSEAHHSMSSHTLLPSHYPEVTWATWTTTSPGYGPGARPKNTLRT